MKTWRKLTETNDWEGETWNFYILITDAEYFKISSRIKEVDPDGDSYELSLDLFTEKQVDKHCKRKGKCTYMKEYNKVKAVDWGYIDREQDPFYKGMCWIGI